MTPVTSGRWLATSSFPPFNPKPRFGSGTDASAEAANLCYFLHFYVSDIQGQFEFFYPDLFPALLASLRGVGLAPQRLSWFDSFRTKFAFDC